MLFRSSAAPRIGLRSRISSLFREPRLEQPPTIASTMIRPNEVKVEVPLTLSLPEARVPKRERRRIFAEHFSKDFGMFYTIDRTLYKGSTLFQELEIVDTKEFGKVMILDGQTQVVERNEYLYHEPMVHPAMTSHPNPEAVCVIGAGDGGIVREVLKHSSCNEVVHVELDEGVVEASKNFFPTLHAGCWEDPRVDLQIVDGRSYIEETKKQFDVIIMDMTDPFGPSTMLYTQEFFTAVKARLRDEHGLFVMHAESSITVPQTFQQIDNTLKSVWPEVHMCHLYIQMYSTLWSIAIAGDRDSVKSLDRNTLAQRLHARGVGGLHAYTPDSHHAMQAGFPFIDALREQAAGLPIITDAHSTFVSSCHVDGSDINELLNPED